MRDFFDFNISRQLLNAIEDLKFDKPTPIQEQSYAVIQSGKDVVGIAQTGTGKTFAYMLPILQNLKFSKQVSPRVLIMVPTRELVLQVVEQIKSYTAYMSTRIVGVYGGTNINTQMMDVAQGCDILVATPGRLYDLIIARAVQLNSIKKLVIDEVDVMLDLGFRYQLTNILDLLPEKRQNIMYSATMTEEVDLLIDDYFISPERISIAVSGTPLEHIEQTAYPVPNFYTKVNLLEFLLADRQVFNKVLVFTSTKKGADYLAEAIELRYGSQLAVLHANKSQNYRIRSIEEFEEGVKRILITTDVMARGLDLTQVSHVINFDTPAYPENYLHRIGRTGRAEQEGKTILFFTPKEEEPKGAIETLMNYEIPVLEFPEVVEVSSRKSPDERPDTDGGKNPNRNIKQVERGAAFHEKKEKNKKTNQGGSYLRKMKRYKKPKTKGDKIGNRKRKK
ncbi:DEAD/DEAH box helicase [Puteibacter caeruleilacunae]|nr:DEAD/DEAH box helicase [Puteibacter caeruleilacunae]